MGAEHTSLVINKAYDIPDVLSLQYNSLKIPQKKFGLPFDESNLFDIEKISKNIRGYDDLRPQFGLVYCFGHFMAVTDAHKLFLIPISKNLKGVINPTNKYEIDSSHSWAIRKDTLFQNHAFGAVMPNYTEENYSGMVDLESLYKYCQFVQMNFLAVRKSIIKNLLFNYENEGETNHIALNCDYLLDCIEVFLNLGIEKVHFYASTPNRPILFTQQKIEENFVQNNEFLNKNVICLLMPVISYDSNSAYLDIDYNIEFNIFYNLTNNKIYDRDGNLQEIGKNKGILSVDEFQYTFKEYKKNSVEVKRILNEVVRDLSIEQIYNHYMSELEKFSPENITFSQKKMIYALNWWRNFATF
jgi:hypothetical protein